MALLLAMGLLCGCAPKEGVGPSKSDKAKEEESEAPPPHNGKLYAVPGHKYHAELLVDEGKKEATVYLLDNRVRQYVPTKAEVISLTIKNGTPLQVELKPQRQDTDPKGASSRFAGTHDRLGEKVDYEKIEFMGMIDGKPFTFTLDKE
jgi:hypothetical protein